MRFSLIPALFTALAFSACGTDMESSVAHETETPDNDRTETSAHGVTASELNLTVRETRGIARTNEVVRSGVPLARSLNALSTSSMAIVDSSGRAVPAEFEVLARWNAGRATTTAPIQWVLVSFAANVAANSSAQYRLVIDGSAANPAPVTRISLTQSGDRITINTGAARFVLDADLNGLFEEIRGSDGTLIATRSIMDGSAGGSAMQHTTVRRLNIERQGALSAVVVLEGAYNLAARGGGGVGSRRRYEFTAGSPTAIVRHSVAFEGDLCGLGSLSCNGVPNGLLVNRVRDALSLSLASPRTVQVVGARGSAALQGSIASGQEAFVRQRLRSSRTAARSFETRAGSLTGTGVAADGGMLAVSGGNRTLAVALDHMGDYEPQALRLLSDGRIAIDVIDDQAWLGAKQGVFATFAVSALGNVASRADLDRLVWAPLNAPLRAWPTARMFNHSQALGEIPTGTLPASVAGYDTLIKNVLDNTIARRADRGLFGISIFGSAPRTWGNPMWGDEIDCGNDPTPGDDWDDVYWCATWTDYHNGMFTAVARAMRTGEVHYLDEIAEPAALRVLHTQIIQCAPNDTNFYCGQAPTGYGGFRSDNNGSHAYFDNLFAYYWLTGDRTVVETVERGARSMRNYLCSRRPSAACTATDAPTDEWAQLSGRVASQWFNAFRFIGLSSNDASFLDDYRSGLARAVTQHYVEANFNGRAYGFWTGGGTRVSSAGSYSTDQLWMASLYDMNNLQRLVVDTGDAAIGSPAVTPSRVIAAWARTLQQYGSTVSGNGTAAGVWPNAMFFTSSGNRIGGALGAVTPNLGGGDPTLYDTGKADLIAAMLRGGQIANDSAVTALGTTLTTMTIAAATADISPISKRQGLFLAPLHAAVARLTPDAAAPAPIGGTTTPPPTGGTTTPPPPTGGTTTPPPAAATTVLHTTFDNFASIYTPIGRARGGFMNMVGSTDIVPAVQNRGVRFNRNGQIVYFGLPVADTTTLLASGDADFYYRPQFASNADDVARTLMVIGDVNAPPYLIVEESDALRLRIVGADGRTHQVSGALRAALWSADEWVNIRVRWDRNDATRPLAIFVDGARVDRGGAAAGWSLSGGARRGLILTGMRPGGSAVAGGVLDDLMILRPAQP